MGAHVLVADDDPHVARMLRDALIRRGYTIDVAGDGEEAFARALARPPDVLVTDVMMPKVDGWTLVRTLREHPKLGKLPVIFLTAIGAEDERLRAFRLGADDYLSKPFRLDELVGRIEKVIKRPEAPNKLPSTGLAGDLAQVGLSTLLVLIEMERKTGLLKLRGPNERPGEIILREGKVIDARLHHGPSSGAECVYAMLTWTAGKFEFNARAVDGTDKIQLPTTHLLMEGARLMDEAAAPAADDHLDMNAIAEWEPEQRTPVVAAAKLAEVVRRSARSSNPPYSSSAAITLPPVSSTAIALPPPLESMAAISVPPVDEPEPLPPPRLKVGDDTLQVRVIKRASWPWLLGAIVAAAAGAATFAIATTSVTAKPVDLTQVHRDADAIAAAIQLASDTAHARADSYASTPVLRAGIETDAATIQDMEKSGELFKAAKGEVVEVFIRGQSALRTPPTAKALAQVADKQTRLDADGPTIELSASSPITTQQNAVGGTLVVAVAADLAAPTALLAQHVRGAQLVGGGDPVTLVPHAGSAASTTDIPLAVRSIPNLALRVDVARATAAVSGQPSWAPLARYTCFGLAALMFVLYLVFAFAAPRPAPPR